MKNIVGKFKRNLDVLLIFVVSFIILLPKTDNFCNQIANIGFDAQNLYLWNYLPQLGVVPIKDTFYPHGIFFYYVASQPILLWIYIFLAPLFFTTIYLVLKKLYRNTPAVYLLAFTTFFLVTTSIVDIRSFNRYGMLLGSSALFALIVSSDIKHPLKGLLIGLIAGLAASASEGIGLNVALIGGLVLVHYYFYSLHTRKKADLKNPRNAFISFGFGFLLGIIPIYFFIKERDMLSEFISWIGEARLIALYAKTQVNYFRKNTVFIILVLVLQASYLINNWTERRENSNIFYSHLLFSSFITNVLLAQRFIVRQMYSLPIIFSLYGLLILLYPAAREVKHKSKHYTTFIIALGVFLFMFVTTFSIPISAESYLNNIEEGVKDITELKIVEKRLCKPEDFDLNKLRLPTAYKEMVSYVKTNEPGSKVFSFPYDPIFYLLLNQPPPPYPNIYEASPIHAQNQNIEYIRNNVDIIVYNTGAHLVDGVPEYVRGLQLTKYIVQNFEPKIFLKSFVLLERIEEDRKIFLQNPKTDSEFSVLSERLLNPDYQSVFSTEGIYKTKRLEKESDELFSGNSFENLNIYLESNDVYSDNLFLLVKFPEGVKKGKLQLNIKDGVETSIKFVSCSVRYCLINLEIIPLFYQKTKLISINGEDNPIEIKLLKLRGESEYYW